MTSTDVEGLRKDVLKRIEKMDEATLMQIMQLLLAQEFESKTTPSLAGILVFRGYLFRRLVGEALLDEQSGEQFKEAMDGKGSSRLDGFERGTGVISWKRKRIGLVCMQLLDGVSSTNETAALALAETLTRLRTVYPKTPLFILDDTLVVPYNSMLGMRQLVIVESATIKMLSKEINRITMSHLVSDTKSLLPMVTVASQLALELVSDDAKAPVSAWSDAVNAFGLLPRLDLSRICYLGIVTATARKDGDYTHIQGQVFDISSQGSVRTWSNRFVSVFDLMVS